MVPAMARARRLTAALVLATLLAPAAAGAVIVNTLSGYGSDPGWSGQLEANASASGGNTELARFGGRARAQWKGELHRFRALASAQRSESNGSRISESALLHLRHNHRLAPRLQSLAFAQLQRNPFQRLSARSLLGLGARVALVDDARGQLGLGLAHMLELERIEDTGGDEDVDHRLSSFLVGELELRGGVSLGATVFAQPRWSDFGDLRATGELGLEVELTGQLSFQSSASLTHDSNPPAGVEETDWSLGSGLGYRF